MKPVHLILISIGLAVIGQLFMKQGMKGFEMTGLTISTFIPIFIRMVLRPFVFFGFTLYLASSFFWLIAISKVPLNYAYPFLSINYVLILLLSWIIFKENVGLVQWLGVAVIMAGVYLISRSG
jgi:multidrug transporter EmrE-like cation transporter